MTRRRRSWLVNGLLVVVLIGAGVAGYLVFFGSPGSAQPAAARTAAAANRDVAETVTAAGTVQSSYTASASFGTSGTVTNIHVKVGDAVVKGQKLAELDPAQAQLQADIAQNNLDAALAKGTGTTALLTAYRQTQLALQQAKEALAATVLTAPGDGTITSVTGAVGQKVGASSTTGFAVVTDLKNLVVHANVSETDVSKLKNDQAATVTVNAMATQLIQAKVTQVDLDAHDGQQRGAVRRHADVDRTSGGVAAGAVGERRGHREPGGERARRARGGGADGEQREFGAGAGERRRRRASRSRSGCAATSTWRSSPGSRRARRSCCRR